jgi:hypothetical protein
VPSLNDPSRAVWLQTGFYINTTPQNGDQNFDQQSWVNVALGGVENGGLVGARRGGANMDITEFLRYPNVWFVYAARPNRFHWRYRIARRA